VAYAFEGGDRDKALRQLSRASEFISREFGINRVFEFYVDGKNIERVK